MSETPLILPALGAVYQALGPWVEALLRFIVGMAIVPHGMRMCLGYFKGTGIQISSLQGVADLFDRKGYKPGKLWAWGVVLTQFVAGPCVALGLFTRPMAVQGIAVESTRTRSSEPLIPDNLTATRVSTPSVA